MRCIVKLLDVDFLAFKLYNSALIVINITVIRCGEDCYYNRKSTFGIPFMHFVTF